MNDDELHNLIRQTHPKPEFPSSFQREVWARIAVVEQQSWMAQWRQWSESLFGWIAQPAPAVALVLTTLLIGVSIGQLTARNNNDVALRTAYTESVNPIAAAHVSHLK